MSEKCKIDLKMEHKFPYKWTLKDAQFTKDKGKVFSCFACGGGSTMGYKLAGFDVIGCNEIDPRMNKVYVANHHPRLNYLCDIREMVTKELPAELYNLDVLDGSPPCSSFSTSGNRDKDWGKEKHFREGQQSQVLDTLFFDFIALAKKLQPKVVIAENVKGLLLGEAMKYVRRIYDAFEDAGYYVQHFLLNAATMGVPQQRERVFFICLRKDLAEPFLETVGLFDKMPYIDMEFNEPPILFGEVADNLGRPLTPTTIQYKLWKEVRDGETDLASAAIRIYGKKKFFSTRLFYKDQVAWTLVPDYHCCLLHKDEPVFLSDSEIVKCSSFPSDYDNQDQKVGYMCGMSVPPVMMAQVASRVYDQWLSKV